MSRFKLRIVTPSLIILMISVGSFKAQAVKTLVQNQEERASLPVSFYVGKLAMKYECSLIYEEAWEEGEPRNQMEAYEVPVVADKRNLQQELEYVRHNVPFFSYEIAEGPPRIIHIKDTRLLYSEGYGMNRVIKNLDFKGTINELITAIGKQEIPIEPETLFPFGEFEDRTTEVQIKGEDLTVREALTKAIAPKRQRISILWVARTKLAANSLTTVYSPFAGKNP